MSYPPSMIADLHASYSKGRSLAEVARMYGLARGQEVSRIFRRAGLPMRPRPRKAPHVPLTPVGQQAAFGPISAERLAELRAEPPRVWGRRGMPPERAQGIITDFLRLKSTRAVGKLWGMTGQAVHDVVSRRGLHRPRKFLPAVEVNGRKYTVGAGGFLRDTRAGRGAGREAGCETLAHREAWRQLHGPIPSGHVVLIRNGNPADLRPENLECLPKSEAMSRLSSGRNGSHTTKEAALVESIEPWIRMQAARIAALFGVEMEDLMQAGRLRAFKTARTYDPSKGAKFLTYAAMGLLSAMRWEARWLKDPVHVPVNRHKEISIGRLELDAPVSIDDPAGTTRGEIFLDESAEFSSVADHAHTSEQVERLREAMNVLTARERAVIERRFFGQEHLNQIGADFGVCRERIRQIEAQALRKLRRCRNLMEAR